MMDLAKREASRCRFLPAPIVWHVAGPHDWSKYAPAAAGSKQSPIDIKPAKAVLDRSLESNPWKVCYNPREAEKLINTGSSIQVTYSSNESSKDGQYQSKERARPLCCSHWR